MQQQSFLMTAVVSDLSSRQFGERHRWVSVSQAVQY